MNKGLAKLRNIAAETMFLVMFPGVAKLGNICFGRKICVREARKENVLPILQDKCLLQKLSQSSTIEKSLAKFLRGLERRSPAILFPRGSLRYRFHRSMDHIMDPHKGEEGKI